MYEGSDDRFEVLVLATADPSVASIGGNTVIVYACDNSRDGFSARATRAIDLSTPYRTLCHRGPNQPLGILCAPSLSKQLHQMEVQVGRQLFQKSIKCHALPRIRLPDHLG